MDMTITLAQLIEAGSPLKTVLMWVMAILFFVLVVVLLARVLRKLFGDTSPARHSAYEVPEQQPKSVTSLFGDESVSKEHIAASVTRSVITPEIPATSSFSDIVPEAPQTVIPTAAAAATTAGVLAGSVPEKKTFAARASREAVEQTGKARSWTSRSLFGKSNLGAQQELPHLEPGELDIAGEDDYIFGPVTPSLAALLPESQVKQKIVKKELVEAGHYEPHAWHNLSAIRYLGLILPIIFFGAGLVFLGTPTTEWVWLGAMIFGAAIGWALPRLMVRSQAARRKSEIEQALPDVIDLLNMCVSQGLTIRSALARVSWEISEVYPAMADELRIVTAQADISSLDQALSNMNERVDSPELHSLSSLLTQTEKMGTNVSDALTDYSDSMRATLQQRADQKANTATFKLLFPTVLCLMPAVYMFLLGPAVVELSDFFKGGGVTRYSQVEGNDQAATGTRALQNRGFNNRQ